MDLELAGKVAVVTGASKGIGLAVARELAAEGALVVAGARTAGPLEGLEGIEPFAVDLVDPEGPARLVEHAVEQHGRPDVLVKNGGGVQLRPRGFSNGRCASTAFRTSATPTSRPRSSSTSSRRCAPCARPSPR